MDKELNLQQIINSIFSWAAHNMGFVVFLFVLSMVYIANNHWATDLIRDLNKESQQLKELRWEYLTEKSDLMYKSKLTEVEPRAANMGLYEMQTPPYKITLKPADYQHQK